MKTAFIYISSEEYLPYAKELYKSLKIHSPESDQILYYIDENQPRGFQWVNFINDDYNNCNKLYTRLQRICSLRAKVVLNAFEKGYDKVIFCGADIKFFNPPYRLLIELCGHDAVVIPHILEPLPEDGKLPSNASVSFTGHINTDLVAFRKTPEIIKFLTWQDEIMKNNCKTTKFTFLDQTWLNFLPFFVENVKILRDPRYNIAYWNYHQRLDILKEMVCFQFSGLDLKNPENISIHQNRYKAEGDFLEFLKDYAEKIK